MKIKGAVVKIPGEIILEGLDVPSLKSDELLVKVKACGVCGTTDRHYMEGECEEKLPLTGFNSYFGHEATGIVEEIGKEVREFKVGDRVSYLGPGYQEYGVVKETRAVKLPDAVSFTEGLAEPLAVVLNTINHASLDFGEDVVILGAGFMGLMLTEGLINSGAGRVIVADIDDRKLEVAKRLGASYTINSSNIDPVKEIECITSGKGLGVVIEAVGVSDTLRQAALMVRANGRIIIHGFYPHPIEINMVPWHGKELTIINSHPSSDHKLKSLMERGIKLLQFKKFNINNLITHRFKLEEISKIYNLMQKGEHFIKIVVEI